MEVKATPMATDVFVDNFSDYNYVDAAIYVKAPDGREWKFSHTYARDEGTFCEGSDVMFAPCKHESFDDYDGKVPYAVQASYEIAIPVAVGMIREVLASEARIPKFNAPFGLLTAESYEATVEWWAKMHAAGLSFHPEDDPTTIVRANGERIFTDSDCSLIKPILARMIGMYGVGKICDIVLKLQPPEEKNVAPIGSWTSRFETVNTGGGCMVDLIHLQDGKVIGISDECVAVYINEDVFWNGDGGEHTAIWLKDVKAPDEESEIATDETRSYGPRS